MNVGFIGVGNMGSHMARHIIEAGHNLCVHDIRKEAAQFLINKGAKWADSPAAVARNCEIVLLSLPGPPQVRGRVWQERSFVGMEEGRYHHRHQHRFPGHHPRYR
jgi:3-hydroxyisobutyrate dehydrogenase